MVTLTTEQEWKSRTNAEYQKVIGLVISLSTAVLILPMVFIREFLAIPSNEPLLSHLSCSAYVSWGLLVASVLIGAIFYYASAKWIKKAFGGTVKMSTTRIESILDWSFWCCILTFVAGVCLFIWFGISNIQTS